MAHRTEQWGQCPKCFGVARWTEIRRVPGGYAGSYRCQLEDSHQGENVPLLAGDQPQQGLGVTDGP